MVARAVAGVAGTAAVAGWSTVMVAIAVAAVDFVAVKAGGLGRGGDDYWGAGVGGRCPVGHVWVGSGWGSTLGDDRRANGAVLVVREKRRGRSGGSTELGEVDAGHFGKRVI